MLACVHRDDLRRPRGGELVGGRRGDVFDAPARSYIEFCAVYSIRINPV